ncbi:cytochrome C550 [Dethiosulfatarculus sandiegensis]|uniref:Cytochrome C550 n=2 Tax=Dethiosulfatarculus sandiegensis TaxID=1429043 RepID=A0A0D2HV33_9BACT|nr:cytochrome C550 [Dethiosulfatarculus sandiegensis]
MNKKTQQMTGKNTQNTEAQPQENPQSSWARWKEEKESSIRNMKLSWYLFRKSPTSMLGAVIVGIFLIMAMIGPMIVPFPEDATGTVHIERKLTAPNSTHLFGTDELGRDIYTRVVLGTRISLQIGLIIILVAMGIGVPLGVTAGYLGGPFGELIMRITDMFLSIPGRIFALAVVGAMGPGMTNCMIALSIVWWPGYVRLVQGRTLAVREESFIEAARSVGAKKWRIIFNHILPNCSSVIIVKASMDMGMAILAAAGLGFIGLGAQPPMPEWGVMISEGRNFLPEWWWYATFPGLAIFTTVLGFNLLGDGLRDILDPQSRG